MYGSGNRRWVERRFEERVEHHYDVGRDFYRLWLDAGMVYSCAYWPTAVDDDIDAAQVAKLDWHATAAGVDVGFAGSLTSAAGGEPLVASSSSGAPHLR